MNFSSIPDAAVGSIGAALIAAIVGIVGLVIAKENKISEFRQAWIDALRVEIGTLIANVTVLRGAAISEHATKQDLFAATQDHFAAVNRAAALIRLRLNPIEHECKLVLTKISELEKLMDVGQDIDTPACQVCEAELISSAHVLLKKEWMRVRRGEWIFVVAKYLGFLVAAILIIVLVFYSCRVVIHTVN